MTAFLIRCFIKNADNTSDPKVRGQYGMLSSGVGIACNLLLFLTKIIMGMLSASITVVADAFNNLSDAGSCLITMYGFRLAQRPADDDHPFGHGRWEYISGLAIAFLILLVGFQFFSESVKKIFDPEPIVFSYVVVAALLCSIGVKLWMSRFYRTLGDKIGSATLAASSADSKNDVFATLVALIAIIAARFTDLPVDGVLGALVALFVLWNGFTVARDTISPILGNVPDPALVKEMEQMLLSFPDIIGVHDLIIHDYGPGRMIASAHAEVPADGDIIALHDTVDQAEKQISAQLGLSLTLHMDPVDLNCPETAVARELTESIIRDLDPSLSLHDFRRVPGTTHTNLVFDLVVPHQYPIDNRTLRQTINAKLKEHNPEYCAVITIDRSYIS